MQGKKLPSHIWRGPTHTLKRCQYVNMDIIGAGKMFVSR